MLIDLVPPPSHLSLVNLCGDASPIGEGLVGGYFEWCRSELSGACLLSVYPGVELLCHGAGCAVVGTAKRFSIWQVAGPVHAPPAVLRVRVLHILTNSVLHLFRFSHSGARLVASHRGLNLRFPGD